MRQPTASPFRSPSSPASQRHRVGLRYSMLLVAVTALLSLVGLVSLQTAVGSVAATPRSARVQQTVAVILTAQSDATLYESSTGSVANGAGEHLFAGRTNNGLRRRAVLRFDLDALEGCPRGSVIESVQLRMLADRAREGNFTIGLYALSADWGEGASNAAGQEGNGAPAVPGDATWLHRDFPTELWDSAGGDFEVDVRASALVGAAGPYTWGSTVSMVDDVQSWLDDPSTNFGWLLRGDETQNLTARRFASRHSETVADRPQLLVVCDPAEITATPLPSATATATTTPTLTSTPTTTPTASATASPTASPSPLPTATPTPLPTATATASPTGTATASPSPTIVLLPTETATVSASATSTSTATVPATTTDLPATGTATIAPSATATQTEAPTQAPTETATVTVEPGATSTGEATPTLDPVLTATVEATATLDPLATGTITATATATGTLPAATNTPLPAGLGILWLPIVQNESILRSATATPTDAPEPSATASAEPAGTETPTPDETATPEGTQEPGATTEPTATDEPKPTEEPTEEPTAEPSATDEPGATTEPTEEPTTEPTAEPTTDPTVEPTAPSSPEPTVAPTGTDVPAPSATPTPTGTATPGTPTVTATPSATVTPDPEGCVRPLRNGGFERDEHWTFGGARPARYAATPVFAGERSLLLGLRPGENQVRSYSSAWQRLRVPPEARSMRVSARLWRGAEEVGSRGDDVQFLRVYDIAPDENGGVGREPVLRLLTEVADDRRWVLHTRSIDVSDRRGEQLWLYTSVFNDGEESRAWMHVDAAEVVFCP